MYLKLEKGREYWFYHTVVGVDYRKWQYKTDVSLYNLALLFEREGLKEEKVIVIFKRDLMKKISEMGIVYLKYTEIEKIKII